MVDADGTNLQRLTDDASSDSSPRSQPIPNNVPVTTTDSLTVPYQTTGGASVLANDTDEEALSGLNLTISVQPTHGTASVNTAQGKIEYTPASMATLALTP